MQRVVGVPPIVATASRSDRFTEEDKKRSPCEFKIGNEARINNDFLLCDGGLRLSRRD